MKFEITDELPTAEKKVGVVKFNWDEIDKVLLSGKLPKKKSIKLAGLNPSTANSHLKKLESSGSIGVGLYSVRSESKVIEKDDGTKVRESCVWICYTDDL